MEHIWQNKNRGRVLDTKENETDETRVHLVEEIRYDVVHTDRLCVHDGKTGFMGRNVHV